MLKAMDTQKKYCPECEDVIRGRIDKKFCSDACRSLYHNRQNAVRSATLKWIDKRLKRNRTILEKLHDRCNPKYGVPLKQVEHMGFTFDFYTHKETLEKKEYVFCYEYGYKMHSDKYIEVIKHNLFGDGLDLIA